MYTLNFLFLRLNTANETLYDIQGKKKWVFLKLRFTFTPKWITKLGMCYWESVVVLISRVEIPVVELLHQVLHNYCIPVTKKPKDNVNDHGWV